MRTTVVVITLMGILAAACGGSSDPFDGSLGSSDAIVDVTTTSDREGYSNSLEGLDQPPDLVVTAGGEELVLSPFGYCWSVGSQGVCVDGVPPDPLPLLTLDSESDLAVEFPLDWQIQATLLPNGDYCDGALTVDVDPDGSPVARLGPADSYQVDLFGRGEQGDAAWSFQLITTQDLPLPPACMQVLWYPSGLELEPGIPFYALLSNLAEKPTSLSAVASVTSSNGVLRGGVGWSLVLGSW